MFNILCAIFGVDLQLATPFYIIKLSNILHIMVWLGSIVCILFYYSCKYSAKKTKKKCKRKPNKMKMNKKRRPRVDRSNSNRKKSHKFCKKQIYYFTSLAHLPTSNTNCRSNAFGFSTYLSIFNTLKLKLINFCVLCFGSLP